MGRSVCKNPLPQPADVLKMMQNFDKTQLNCQNHTLTIIELKLVVDIVFGKFTISVFMKPMRYATLRAMRMAHLRICIKCSVQRDFFLIETVLFLFVLVLVLILLSVAVAFSLFSIQNNIKYCILHKI